MIRDGKSAGTDERNFRSSYYEKVGFRSVEEKRSLEIILKEKPLDRLRLRNFALRFSVPASFKNLIWKILLGVVPVHLDNYDIVMEQRQQQYEDLKHSLGIIGIAFKDVSKSQFCVIMWLLESGKLKLSWRAQVEEEHYKCLVSISNSMMNMFDDDVDIYWLSKGIFQCVEKFNGDISKLVQFTESILEKEDNEVYCFFVQLGAFACMPFNNWFWSCFSNVITESSVGKIWDKVAAGSCKILVFVAVVIIITLRRRILKCDTVKGVLECTNKISDELSDVIVSKAIEMWQQNGSSLMPASGLEHKGHTPSLWL